MQPARKIHQDLLALNDDDSALSEFELVKLEREVHSEYRAGHLDETTRVNALGIICSRLQRFAEAEQFFHQAARLQPESWQAHLNLAASQISNGRDENALESLITASEMEQGDNVEVYGAIAVAFLETGRYEGALHALSSAIGAADFRVPADAQRIVRLAVLLEQPVLAIAALARLIFAKAGTPFSHAQPADVVRQIPPDAVAKLPPLLQVYVKQATTPLPAPPPDRETDPEELAEVLEIMDAMRPFRLRANAAVMNAKD